MPNTADALWNQSRTAPTRIALRSGDGPAWTYADLRSRAAAVAGSLRAAGVEAGDRVLLSAPSVPEFAGAYHGIHATGAVVVPVNTMAPRPELEYVGADAEVAAVLGWHGLGPAPEEAAAALGVPFRTLHPGLAGLAEAPALDEPHGTADDDLATLLYTSGTTGRPKGAQLTHRNVLACASAFVTMLGLAADDRVGTALPLFHVSGQICIMGATFQAGASLSLLERFDAGAMLAMLRRDGLTHMAGVPTSWNALLHALPADLDASAFAGLRMAVSGGAALPLEVLSAFESRLGCRIVEGYGLSETSGAATFHAAGAPLKPGSVGRALPGFRIAVRDGDGRDVAADVVGEIFVSGPAVMKGYWKRPEATADAMRDGWLRTGDLGVLDTDGDLRIVGRLKEVVIRGGYNVYPREVEEVLHQHPDVVEVAVLGVPDEHYGEEVAALVALRPGARRAPAELRSWAKERLSAYKVPHLIAFADELPRGGTGKILKRAIDPALFRDPAR